MSISFQSKDDGVLSVALKVQELCVMLGDPVLSDDGANSLIDVKEPIAQVRAALVVVPGAPVAAKAATVDSGTKIKIPSLLAPGESFVVKYVIAE